DGKLNFRSFQPLEQFVEFTNWRAALSSTTSRNFVAQFRFRQPKTVLLCLTTEFFDKSVDVPAGEHADHRPTNIFGRIPIECGLVEGWFHFWLTDDLARHQHR